jgi:hypothetical protein
MNSEVDVKIPANPAKGKLQGQTTLAAKLDRWMGLNNNLTANIDQVPQLKDQLTQFQATLASTQALRDRLRSLQGELGDAMTQRNELFATGDDLYTRLNLALRSIHGPQSRQLETFGLKPRKPGGRPRKAPVPAPAPPPSPEAQTHSAASTAPSAPGTPPTAGNGK